MKINTKNLILVLFSLASTVPATVSSRAMTSKTESIVQKVHFMCSFTRYPRSCKDTLLATRAIGIGNDSYADLVSILVEKVVHDTSLMLDGIKSQQIQKSFGYCDELMKMSLKKLNQSFTSLKNSPNPNKPDIQTWLSAVITFQDSCRDSIINQGITLTNQISHQMDLLSVLTSHTLALANLLTINKTESKYDGIPNQRRRLLEITSIQAVVVAQDGSGNYMTVSEAVEAAPGDQRYVIYVLAGVYKEKVTVNKDNVMLVGDGKEETVITHSSSVGGGSTLQDSATIGMEY